MTEPALKFSRVRPRPVRDPFVDLVNKMTRAEFIGKIREDLCALTTEELATLLTDFMSPELVARITEKLNERNGQ